MNTVAVVGAAGFIGRRLAQHLGAAGADVRALVRRPGSAPGGARVTEVAYDLAASGSQAGALAGVGCAYYLVHAMGAGPGFPERDRRYAERFAEDAREAGVGRVVYLGGLHPRGVELSPHLASRREVGAILRDRCDALVVRAGIVIGAGSASFEIMRDLVRHLPVMTTPRWVQSRCQPVDIGDVLEALRRAAEVPGGREVDLAGPDVLSYQEMLERLATQLHRRPVIVPVPVLTPELSAHWLRFVTSADLNVARALIESLRHDAVADGDDLCREVGVDAIGFEGAVRRALAAEGGAAPPPAETSRRWWDRGRYHLIQRFGPMPPQLRDAETALHQLDARLLARAVGAVPRLHDDRGTLSIAGVALIRLGEPRIGAGDAGIELRRDIGPGLLVRSPGGEVRFECREENGELAISAILDGYAPRLPRLLYRLFQEPYHRRLVRRSVADVARGPAGP